MPRQILIIINRHRKSLSEGKWGEINGKSTDGAARAPWLPFQKQVGRSFARGEPNLGGEALGMQAEAETTEVWQTDPAHQQGGGGVGTRAVVLPQAPRSPGTGSADAALGGPCADAPAGAARVGTLAGAWGSALPATASLHSFPG